MSTALFINDFPAFFRLRALRINSKPNCMLLNIEVVNKHTKKRVHPPRAADQGVQFI